MKKFFLYLWQLPQNLIGLILSIGCKKRNWFGINFYIKKKFFKSGISLGKYIIIDERYIAYGDYQLSKICKHEKGHSVQSEYLGWFYLLIVGIPSFIRIIIKKIFKKSDKWYFSGYPEKWADTLGGVKR